MNRFTSSKVDTPLPGVASSGKASVRKNRNSKSSGSRTHGERKSFNAIQVKRYNALVTRLDIGAGEKEPSGSPFCERHGIQAVIFDCDGVLLDSGKAYYLAYEKVLDEEGAATSPREIYLLEGKPTPQVLEAVLAGRGKSVTPSQIREMVERRREYQSGIGRSEFFSGIWSMLARLRSAGYKLAMVTGSSRKSIDLVFTSELKGRFDAIVTANDVRHPKPDPEPFSLAAEMMGIASANCLVIENAPYGVEAAKAAGCRVIGICTTLAAEDLQGADWIAPHHNALQSLLWETEDAHRQQRTRSRERALTSCAATGDRENKHGHD